MKYLSRIVWDFDDLIGQIRDKTFRPPYYFIFAICIFLFILQSIFSNRFVAPHGNDLVAFGWIGFYAIYIFIFFKKTDRWLYFGAILSVLISFYRAILVFALINISLVAVTAPLLRFSLISPKIFIPIDSILSEFIWIYFNLQVVYFLYCHFKSVRNLAR
jgi:hypothetical protein